MAGRLAQAKGVYLMLPVNKKREKKEVPVNIVLTDGITLECCIFAAYGQRLLDIMNDERSYIPYTDESGDITIIQKSTIGRITPVDQTNTKKAELPLWTGISTG